MHLLSLFAATAAISAIHTTTGMEHDAVSRRILPAHKNAIADPATADAQTWTWMKQIDGYYRVTVFYDEKNISKSHRGKIYKCSEWNCAWMNEATNCTQWWLVDYEEIPRAATIEIHPIPENWGPADWSKWGEFTKETDTEPKSYPPPNIRPYTGVENGCRFQLKGNVTTAKCDMKVPQDTFMHDKHQGHLPRHCYDLKPHKF